jgi:hypothetical protein
MKPTLSLAAPVALLACIGWVILSRDYGGSPDIAHHYALSEELFRQFRWPLKPSPNLAGGTDHYPPLAHLLAGLVGILTGSSLSGIFLLSAAAVVVLFLMAGFIVINERPPHIALISSALLLALAGVMSHRNSFFGHEIIANFFYAQLVGNVVVFAALLAATRWDRDRNPNLWVIGGPALVALATTTYLLSGIQLALALVALVAMPALRDNFWRHCWEALALAFLLALVVILHPSFWPLVELSPHEGWISITPRSTLLTAFVAAAGLGFAILSFWLGNNRRWLWIVIPLSVAALGGFTLQIAAFFLGGTGSAYVLAKHGFFLGVAAVLLWTCLLADLCELLINRAQRALAPNAVLSFSCVLAAGLVLVVYMRPSHSLGPMISHDRLARQLAKAKPELLSKTASSHPRLALHGNYSVALGALLASPEIAAAYHSWWPEGYRTPPIAGPATYVLLSSEANYPRACLVDTTPVPAAVLSIRCVLSR